QRLPRGGRAVLAREARARRAARPRHAGDARAPAGPGRRAAGRAGGGEPAALHGPVGPGAGPVPHPRSEVAGARGGGRGRRRARVLRGGLRPGPRGRPRRAPPPRAAPDRPWGRAGAAGLRTDRPYRQEAGRDPGPARLQDGAGAPGRERDLPRGEAAADPVLHPGRGRDVPRPARGEGLPRLRGRRPAGGAGPRLRARRRLPPAASRHGGRHRRRPVRPGSRGLHVVRLHGGLRAGPAHRAQAPVQDGRRARPARAAPAGPGMSGAPVDRDARAEARDDHGTSLVLEAGAGTGKTTLLIDRMEALVRSGHARLEEIAAVTFTENAATTMKLRLRERLERARADAAVPEAERRRAALALDVLERAQVSTIHALCAAILAERPLECGVVPGFRTADEAETDLLFSAAWEEWLADRLVKGDDVLLEALDSG